jgi:hypothetical protein
VSYRSHSSLPYVDVEVNNVILHDLRQSPYPARIEFVKMTSPVKAQSNPESRIELGFEIAPVRLNMEGEDPALVGLGSYSVNASGGCNDCHSAGPQTQYLPGGNPYFGWQTQINPATYLEALVNWQKHQRYCKFDDWVFASGSSPRP